LSDARIWVIRELTNQLSYHYPHNILELSIFIHCNSRYERWTEQMDDEADDEWVDVLYFFDILYFSILI
jgi:hypothetical protein